jgi:hypothetical protein
MDQREMWRLRIKLCDKLVAGLSKHRLYSDEPEQMTQVATHSSIKDHDPLRPWSSTRAISVRWRLDGNIPNSPKSYAITWSLGVCEGFKTMLLAGNSNGRRKEPLR